jgi:hypothetical protein
MSGHIEVRCALGLAVVAAGVVGLLQTGQGVASAEAALAVKAPPAAPRSPAAERQAIHAYGKLPLGFTPNAGRLDPRVRYSARAGGHSFYFTRNEAVLAFAQQGRGMALRLRFLGAAAEPVGTRTLPGRVNYLIGNDSAKWRTGLRSYGEVVYRDLWPGIDLSFRGRGGTLKYEFRLSPGADVRDIGLAYRGAERLSLGHAGELRIHTPLGLLRDTRPASYQVIAGRRVPVESRFVLEGGGAYRFGVGRYDVRRPLVIDPGLVYSTYLGGSSRDEAYGVAVDAAGSAYVAGLTGGGATPFPTTAGAFDTSANGNVDVFVTKLNAAGSAVVYSTYVGGLGRDEGLAIAVDGAGSAFVTGITLSSNFPTTNGAFDKILNSFDAYVTKLKPDGSELVYSTYLGGTGTEQGFGIAVDAAGNAHVTGVTTSTSFPTTVGAFSTTFNGNIDAFVTKLNATGSALVYSTFLGGSGDDRGFGLALDGAGSAYVNGRTGSTNFPTTEAAFDRTFNGAVGSSDAFVTKLNTAGSALLYSTYLGGMLNDQGVGIAVDALGGAYATGFTASENFPTTPAAFDTTFNKGTNDAFVTRLDPGGSTLAYSTYLGGELNDQGIGIAVDGAGSAHVAGFTSSTSFPMTLGAFDTTLNGGSDAFATQLTAIGSGLVYSTYLGGAGTDQGSAMALDGAGNGYVTGITFAAGFPTTAGAFDASFNGVNDAFVTKLDFIGAPATLTLAPKTATNTVGTPHTVTATVRDVAGNPVPGVTVRFSVSGANSAGGSATTDVAGHASFTYTGTTAGLDLINAFADSNDNGTQDAGEPSDAATKTWKPGPPATVTLFPPAAVNTLGTQHCVTATVRDVFANPVPSVTVIFSVPTAVATHASPSSGSAVTGANGEATFCFTAALPGADTIHAFADSDNDGTQDLGEPFGDAAKTWTLPPSTAFCEVTINVGGSIIAVNGDVASFSGNAKVSADGLSVQGHEHYRDQGPVQPRDVDSIALLAATCSNDLTTATIFGTATIDGSGTFVFRIDVIDNGEPGTNDFYGIIMSDGYASGQQQLRSGNVQIHKS